MSLDECLTRFDWASHHLEHLKAELAPLQRAYRDAAVTQELKQGGKVIEYALEGGLPVTPPEIGLRIGDCAHNFRATLDNLAYSIAVDNNPRLPSKERHAVTFPICTQRSDWVENVLRKNVIAKLPPRAQATIQALQPYKRGPDAHRHPLAVLRALSDMDKHRTMAVVAWNYAPLGRPRIYNEATQVTQEVPGSRWEMLTDEWYQAQSSSGSCVPARTRICKCTSYSGSASP